MTSGALIGLLAALVATATGVLLLRGPARRNGTFLIVAGAALLSALVRPPTGPAAFTLSLLLAPLPAVAVAAAGTSWPVVPLTSGSRWLVLAVVAVVWTIGGLVPTLLFDPERIGCFECPANLLQLMSEPSASADLRHVAAALAFLWAPLLIALAALRWRRAPALTRRHSWPMVAGGVVAALSAVDAAVQALASPVEDADPVGTLAWWVVCGCVLLLALGVVAHGHLVRTAGRRMARTVLAAISDPDSVVASLRRTLGDDSLDVVYLRDDGSAIAADGHEAPTRAAARVPLSRDHVPFAEVRLDPRLIGSSDLIRTAVASASLTLEHLAAQARLRAAIAEHAALRARIVADGDLERRRLERNLHDGAQQQLVGLGILLASSQDADSTESAQAHEQIDLALHELREIARGVFPAGLAEDGIEAALRELGDHTRCALAVAGTLVRPLPGQAGPAVYQLVHDATAAVPPPGSVRVSLAGGGLENIRVVVETTVPIPDAQTRILHAIDRFAAAGGRVRINSDDVSTRCEGELPCA